MGVQCCTQGCTAFARWALMPGFDNGRERFLCGRHLFEVREASPIEADCYAPIGREMDYRSRLIPQPTP
jgi:hypothetical protein